MSGISIFTDQEHYVIQKESSVAEVLAEARKHDFGLITSTQFADQFAPKKPKKPRWIKKLLWKNS